jgi:hypothetical protein
MGYYRVLVRELWFNGFCQLLAKFNPKEETNKLYVHRLPCWFAENG